MKLSGLRAVRASRGGWLLVSPSPSSFLRAAPAQAHSISSRLIAYYPSFLDGYIWDFVSEHDITGCVNTGDSTTCAQGFTFNVWAGAQIKLAGQWKALGTVNKAFATYPQQTKVIESYTIYCGKDDVGSSFTFRTRAKAGIKHNGTWYFSSWGFSDPRTETCTTYKASSPDITSLPTSIDSASATSAIPFWDVTIVSGQAG